MTISVIVATDENNAIGKNNQLLCHLPNDLKFFKSVTNGKPVIMGRKTFESLPKGALPNRRNIVITRNKNLLFENCEMCSSVKEAISLCNEEAEVFFIGGETIYKEAIDFSDTIYRTLIHYKFRDADTFFPEIKTDIWKEVSKEDHDADERHKYGYSFIKYEKIKR